VRVRALNVAFTVICHGSGADDLARAITRAWDWCLDADSDDAGPDSGQELREEVALLLEYDAAELSAAAPGHELYGSDLDTLMDNLSPLITRLAVTAQAGRLLMFHACALADPATGGTAILFGPSGIGKTTLARTLGRRFAYLTDETAAIDETMRLHAYPKPLSILETSDSALKRQVSPGELGLTRDLSGACSLRALIQLSREPDLAGAAIVEELHTVDALPALAAQTSFSRRYERPLHRMAAVAHHVGGIRKISYREAEQVGPLVAELLGEGAA
jgi:hypothetical protein